MQKGPHYSGDCAAKPCHSYGRLSVRRVDFPTLPASSVMPPRCLNSTSRKSSPRASTTLPSKRRCKALVSCPNGWAIRCCSSAKTCSRCSRSRFAVRTTSSRNCPQSRPHGAW
ncbi:Unknown protein sequence [Pseudomonas syringae pv. aceris]|nr:Unknown protein sequence [Pseudomonas syringae pv. aceris]